jgi:pimeloyl-ACP methyl ester carboxylesterase
MAQTLGLASLAPVTAQDGGSIRWEPYETMGADERPITGQLGRLTVPENRGEPDGPTLELAFVRFPSTNPDPGPPIFVLEGGPGGPGVTGCVGPATGRRVRLIDVADVIGLDQRGTGLSVPNLSEAPDFASPLPADRVVGREEVLAAHRDAVGRCRAYWEEQGVDLTAYNSVESADDVDAVRRALGYEQITLWGASYGTHLGLSYLRRHPEHVARAVLMRIEGPDHTFKFPSTTQRFLEGFAERVAADPTYGERLPDVVDTVERLLEKLERRGRTVPLEQEGAPDEITVGPFDLQFLLANALGLAFQEMALPAKLDAMARGDFGPLAEEAWYVRSGGVGSAMSLMMDCASGATPERLDRIAREARDSANLLGDAVNVPYNANCDTCEDGDLGDDYRQTFDCDVPVMFVSGDWDARTPPENADEVAARFSRGVQILVRGAGHESLEVMSPQFQGLLQDFLRGEDVEPTSVQMPTFPYEPPFAN